MSDEPGEQPLVPRLRAVIGAKDEQIASLTASLEMAVARLNAAAAEIRAAREREQRLELRVAELERRLSMDSTDSGTPSLEGADRGEGGPEGQAAVRAGAQQGPQARRAPRIDDSIFVGTTMSED